FRFHERLHLLTEAFTAQVNLAGDFFPRIVRGAARISHKAAIAIASLTEIGPELGESPVHFQPRRRGCEAGGRAVVAPFVISRVPYGATSNRIKNNVANQLEQVRLALHEDVFEAALEEVAYALVYVIAC